MEDKGLTIKQRKWLDLYIKTGNATQSAMAVYDCKDEGSAANIGYENVRKLDINDLLEASGITEQRLADKLNQGLDSNRVISARITSKDANGQTDDFIDVPDMMARHKYLETAYKLKGRFVEKSEITGRFEVIAIAREPRT